MSVYVMSDIHGEYSTFLALLREIKFSDTDELYVLGDVVDRGPEGVTILRHIMKRDNIHMLLGNHEYMCLQYFAEGADEMTRRRWNRNGNYKTLVGLDKLSETERKEIFDFLKGLPDEAMVEVKGKKYYLVHGFSGENTHDRVWNRPKIDQIPEIPGKMRLICGHTPVSEYICPGDDEEMYVTSRKLTNQKKHFMILHAKGFTDIDCCVGYGMSAARLACLRLDDGKEFYQKVE